jgi:hypothetical protein
MLPQQGNPAPTLLVIALVYLWGYWVVTIVPSERETMYAVPVESSNRAAESERRIVIGSSGSVAQHKPRR